MAINKTSILNFRITYLFLTGLFFFSFSLELIQNENLEKTHSEWILDVDSQPNSFTSFQKWFLVCERSSINVPLYLFDFKSFLFNSNEHINVRYKQISRNLFKYRLDYFSILNKTFSQNNDSDPYLI